jgi:hypothetical protein
MWATRPYISVIFVIPEIKTLEVPVNIG